MTDKRTGLVCKRCSEGQTLSGNSCTGTAGTYTHEAALALAQSQNTGSSPMGWRLPNVRELSSLVDKGCQNPTIDGTAFPNTPSNWYWSSSPYAGDGNYAWHVDFASGWVDYFGEGIRSNSNSNSVRLVRTSQ